MNLASLHAKRARFAEGGVGRPFAARNCGTRADRVGARLRGEAVPDFAALTALAEWDLGDTAQRDRMAMVTALLHYRAHIDRAIDGASLSMLAGLVGESAFDSICLAAMPFPEQLAPLSQPLPRGSALVDIGRRLMDRANSDAALAALCRDAARIAYSDVMEAAA